MEEIKISVPDLEPQAQQPSQVTRELQEETVSEQKPQEENKEE